MNRLETPVLNMIGLKRDSDRYIVLYDADNKAEALKQLGRWACNKELNFGWMDAARLSQELHKENP